MKHLYRLVAVASAAFFIVCSPVAAQWQTPDHSVPVGRGAGTGFKSAGPGTNNQALMGVTGSEPVFRAIIGADLPLPGASSLGGTQSKTCSSSNWLNAISTSGVPGCSQPTFSDLSGAIASGQVTGSYPGITGVGTITAGTWNGSTIDILYGGTGATSASSARTNLGLGNVDNTSDATKNAAIATLTNKTLTSPVINSATGSAASSFTATTQSARDNSTKLATTAYVDLATRERLTANRTYYVRTDGSDSNNGLSNTSGGAFLTIQKAWNVIMTIDLAGYTVTIQIADGTYAAGLSITAPALGGTVILNGNSSTPTNVVISTANCISLNAPGTAITIQNLRLTSTNAGISVLAPGALVTLGPGVSFAGTPTQSHMDIRQGKVSVVSNNFTIAGGGNTWVLVQQFGVLEVANLTITFSGTPAWTGSGIGATNGGLVSLWSTTMSGAATGKRYEVSANSIINSFGAGTSSSYFPGNSNGTTASGGQQL